MISVEIHRPDKTVFRIPAEFELDRARLGDPVAPRDERLDLTTEEDAARDLVCPMRLRRDEAPFLYRSPHHASHKRRRDQGPVSGSG